MSNPNRAKRPSYNPDAWFWRVGDQIYSSAAGGYVLADDAAYVAFLAAGGVPTGISADDLKSVVVPQEVTMRQARLALLAVNKLADVATAINAMSEPDKTAATITWEYSQTVQRNNPFVLTLGAALGLDSDGLDALFVDAATR